MSFLDKVRQKVSFFTYFSATFCGGRLARPKSPPPPFVAKISQRSPGATVFFSEQCFDKTHRLSIYFDLSHIWALWTEHFLRFNKIWAPWAYLISIRIYDFEIKKLKHKKKMFHRRTPSIFWRYSVLFTNIDREVYFSIRLKSFGYQGS